MKPTTQRPCVISVSVDAISHDAASQARHTTDAAVAEGYAEAMRDGAEFPPVILFRDADGMLRVGDGWHRITAARLAGMPTIRAEVREGGLRDALACSIAANAHHGLPFSNRDKRRVVGLMLDDPEWSRLADREIARRCGVSQPFVGKLRAERRDNGYHPSADREPLTATPKPLPGQQALFDPKPAPEPEPEPDTSDDPTGATPSEARWLKFFDQLNLFFVSLPRRGGIVNLTRHWGRKQIESARAHLEQLRDMADQCLTELRELEH